MRRFFVALTLAAALASPLIAPAIARAGEGGAATIMLRIYDPYRHDYHVWDHREDRAYREYLAERHRAYIRYRAQRLSERRAYWRWRHEHEWR